MLVRNACSRRGLVVGSDIDLVQEDEQLLGREVRGTRPMAGAGVTGGGVTLETGGGLFDVHPLPSSGVVQPVA